MDRFYGPQRLSGFGYHIWFFRRLLKHIIVRNNLQSVQIDAHNANKVTRVNAMFL
jgi:hypothetical protein